MKASLINKENIFSNNATISVIDNIPFVVRRVFYIHSSEIRHDRGDHAHRNCHQIYGCITGTVSVECYDGTSITEYTLSPNGPYLYVPPMIWSKEKNFDRDTIFLVLCSEEYLEEDYIRSFKDYLEEINEEKEKSMGQTFSSKKAEKNDFKNEGTCESKG